MSNGKARLTWFDANRVFAAVGVVLIHATNDTSGKAFSKAEVSDRIFPVLLRSLGEFSGSEMFFFFSLFLMAMRVDRKLPNYRDAIGTQANRLLVPFVVWTIFYAFFRLAKAYTFNYGPNMLEQLGSIQNWTGYFLLGNAQYHMHFLPTLFLLFLFYPVMRLGSRFPILGLSVFFTLSAMNSTQEFVYSLNLDPLTRQYLIRFIKVFGYVGYGFAAFAAYGLWRDGIPRGESKLLWRGALFFAALAYMTTLPNFFMAIQSGEWQARTGSAFYGHFLMPIVIFGLFIGAQYGDWSPIWSRLAKYTFGVYLLHPFVIDSFDITMKLVGLLPHLSPTALVILRIGFVLPATLGLVIAISKFKPTAWTIGLGPAPWEWDKKGSVKS